MTEKTWYAEERFRGDGWMILSSEPFDIGKAATQVVALLDYSGPEAEKNAHKLAAAPDLYEALEAVLLQYLSAPSGATFGDGLLDQERAEAALRKAGWEASS